MTAEDQAVKPRKNSLNMSGKFLDKLVQGVPFRADVFSRITSYGSGTPLFWLRLCRAVLLYTRIFYSREDFLLFLFDLQSFQYLVKQSHTNAVCSPWSSGVALS